MLEEDCWVAARTDLIVQTPDLKGSVDTRIERQGLLRDDAQQGLPERDRLEGIGRALVVGREIRLDPRKPEAREHARDRGRTAAERATHKDELHRDIHAGDAGTAWSRPLVLLRKGSLRASFFPYATPA